MSMGSGKIFHIETKQDEFFCAKDDIAKLIFDYFATFLRRGSLKSLNIVNIVRRDIYIINFNYTYIS